MDIGEIIMSVETWVLIIWMWGSKAEPNIPTRVDEYSRRELCERAASVWRNHDGGKYPLNQRHALCIPGEK